MTKPVLRERILAARRAVPAQVRLAEATALQTHLRAAFRPGDTVCGYVPVGSEPGSPAMLDALDTARVRVLLPVARARQPMQWGAYSPGRLVAAPFGLREPAPPWLGPEAIGTAAAVLVPALAVDRRGVRLGRGAGFYDRALPLADPAARLIAVVRDDEVLDELPMEPHDVPMTHVVTPGRGIVALAMRE
ncbi:5-formyltetrahydrofolate cyclo-ligase [Mycolicibacterium canariasense]|uniref:5-formyltetrahydrofolate cyclo-ligase n=1 Tax=Mycolicibacterium canariasense TaxID=228230 RepID=A0A100WA47_MYCCR|nr:5-formyltetrahydrofolate cyclo-ligase [Mycolicibacterium canariasense]MCV7212090.1 5-formyltetrahydrofolate cyclo-ligase [Mycolicibacterium canariasense]GAS94273.1 5-formyltetrahydrofolate cyclo-ligase [Mycolicibacterium canariasense]